MSVFRAIGSLVVFLSNMIFRSQSRGRLETFQESKRENSGVVVFHRPKAFDLY